MALPKSCSMVKVFSNTKSMKILPVFRSMMLKFIVLVFREAISGLIATIWLIRCSGVLPIPTAELKLTMRSGHLSLIASWVALIRA